MFEGASRKTPKNDPHPRHMMFSQTYMTVVSGTSKVLPDELLLTWLASSLASHFLRQCERGTFYPTVSHCHMRGGAEVISALSWMALCLFSRFEEVSIKMYKYCAAPCLRFARPIFGQSCLRTSGIRQSDSRRLGSNARILGLCALFVVLLGDRIITYSALLAAFRNSEDQAQVPKAVLSALQGGKRTYIVSLKTEEAATRTRKAFQ